jgi:hypothetical protein
MSLKEYSCKSWDDFLGNIYIVKALKNAIEKKCFYRSYLFCGPNHSGKFLLAQLFAQYIKTIYKDSISVEINKNTEEKLFHYSTVHTVWIIRGLHFLSSHCKTKLYSLINTQDLNNIFIFSIEKEDDITNELLDQSIYFSFSSLNLIEQSKLLRKKINFNLPPLLSTYLIIYCNDNLIKASSLLENFFSNYPQERNFDYLTETIGIWNEEETYNCFQVIFEKRTSSLYEIMLKKSSSFILSTILHYYYHAAFPYLNIPEGFSKELLSQITFYNNDIYDSYRIIKESIKQQDPLIMISLKITKAIKDYNTVAQSNDLPGKIDHEQLITLSDEKITKLDENNELKREKTNNNLNNETKDESKLYNEIKDGSDNCKEEKNIFFIKEIFSNYFINDDWINIINQSSLRLSTKILLKERTRFITSLDQNTLLIATSNLAYAKQYIDLINKELINKVIKIVIDKKQKIHSKEELVFCFSQLELSREIEIILNQYPMKIIEGGKIIIEMPVHISNIERERVNDLFNNLLIEWKSTLTVPLMNLLEYEWDYLIQEMNLSPIHEGILKESQLIKNEKDPLIVLAPHVTHMERIEITSVLNDFFKKRNIYNKKIQYLLSLEYEASEKLRLDSSDNISSWSSVNELIALGFTIKHIKKTS